MSDIIAEMVNSGVIEVDDCEKIKQSLHDGMDVHSAVMLADNVNEAKLVAFWAQTLGYEYVNALDDYKPSKSFLAKFSAKVLLEKKIAPVIDKDGRILALIVNPFEQIGRAHV